MAKRGRPPFTGTDKVCKSCGKRKPLDAFTSTRATCKVCRAVIERGAGEREANRAFNRLVRWPAVLLIITGIYSHDYVDGLHRICFYETVYGDRAVTLRALQMCPLTWEFEE